MPIDLILNSGTGRSTYFFQMLKCGNVNSSQTPKIILYQILILILECVISPYFRLKITQVMQKVIVREG